MYSKHLETTKYYEKNSVDKVIERIINTLDGEISQSDLSKVAVAACVADGIEKYRQAGTCMDARSIRLEEHCSALLGAQLEARFGPRPPRCHAHAIVAGKHALSAPLRLIAAKLKIRIDDPDNGCWLPESTAATPHPMMPSAPPHSRIHRYNYYFWLSSRLEGIRNPNVFRTGLKLIAKMLYTGTIPDYVLLPKGQGLPR